MLNAQVDTRAEMTMIPARHLAPVANDLLQTVRLRSHWGEPSTFKMYVVDLLIGDERLPAVEEVADQQGSALLLGRNILNKLILLLDGSKERTDILPRRPSRLHNRGQIGSLFV